MIECEETHSKGQSLITRGRSNWEGYEVDLSDKSSCEKHFIEMRGQSEA